MFSKIFSTPNDRVLTFMRVILGVVMFAHGAQKMLGWFGGGGFSATMAGMSQGFPAPLVFLAIMAEFFGSLGLIFGFLTRIGAFGISMVMIVAALKVHLGTGFFMNWSGSQQGEGFEYHLLALALSIGLMIKGAGAFSIDRLLMKTPDQEVVVTPEYRKIA